MKSSLAGRQHLQHPQGIGLPVGGGVEETAGADDPGQPCHEFRIEDAPLVVALLGPGVGKEQIDPRQAGGGQAPVQQVHGVLAQQAQVAQAAPFDLQQQVANAGAMDLDAEVIALGVARGDLRQGLAIAEADLQIDGLVVTKQSRQVEGLTRGQLDAVAGPELGEGALLGLGQPALAQHIAADGTPLGRMIRR
jgi:hypothetical protein